MPQCGPCALSSGRCSPLLLEAFPAKYRASLRRLERNSGFLAALRTDGPRFDLRIAAGSRSGSQHAGPLRFARLTPLGLVLELLVVEKQLLPGSENKIRAAVHALQSLVLEFHWKSSLQPTTPVRRRLSDPWLRPVLPGPLALRARE